MQKTDASKALSNKTLMDQFDAMHTAFRNMCLSTAGLAIGSSAAAKVKIVNTVIFLASGIFKSKATAEVAFTATTHDIPPAGGSVQEAMYLLTLASDGTPTLTMGAIATGSGAALMPERPATGTPIGAVRVAVAAGATLFDASTDALDAGHLTVTYYNIGGPFQSRFDATQ